MSTSALIHVDYRDGDRSRSFSATTSHDGYPEAIIGDVVPEWEAVVSEEGIEGLLFKLMSDTYGLDLSDDMAGHFGHYSHEYQVTIDGDGVTVMEVTDE